MPTDSFAVATRRLGVVERAVVEMLDAILANWAFQRVDASTIRSGVVAVSFPYLRSVGRGLEAAKCGSLQASSVHKAFRSWACSLGSGIRVQARREERVHKTLHQRPSQCLPRLRRLREKALEALYPV